MRVCVLALVLGACSTVGSLQDRAPAAELATAKPLTDFQSCFAAKTSRQNVAYLPRLNGGSFSAHVGAYDYVSWSVTVDDLGSSRSVKVYAVNDATARNLAIPPVNECL